MLRPSAAIILVTAALAGCLTADEGPAGLDPAPPGDPAAHAASNVAYPESPHTEGTDNKGDARANACGRADDRPPHCAEDGKPYDPGWPDIDVATIRPGVRIPTKSPTGVECTANFIFATPDNRTLYIGTASHCLQAYDLDEDVTVAGIEGAGFVTYCSYMHITDSEGCPPGPGQLLSVDDFALVGIHDEHRGKVHPAILHWGGPTGIGEAPAVDTKLHAYGNSSLIPSPALSPMEGYAAGSNEGTTYMHIVFPRPGIFGDSGSPVVHADGQAVGHFQAPDADDHPGSARITNLQPVLDAMTDRTGLEVEIKTWPVLDPGVLP